MTKMQNAFFVSAGIACGKSTFINVAKEMGFKTLSADEINHKLLDLHAKTLGEMFGKEILKEGRVNRRALGELVFKNKELKLRLEEFIHPLIKKELLKEAKSLELLKKPFFIELPLFFESKAYEGKVIVIYSSKEMSLQRLMKRDGFSKDEALRRINSLIDIEEKVKKADFVIKNLSTYEDFIVKCREFLQNLGK